MPSRASAPAQPWLPVAQAHSERSVHVQESQPDSVLNGVRHLLRWRKAHPALVLGDIRFLDAPEPVLAFVRSSDEETLLAVYNLSASPVQWTPPQDLADLTALTDHGLLSGGIVDGMLQLPAHSVFYARLG
jgi:alpha-glucosidase